MRMIRGQIPRARGSQQESDRAPRRCPPHAPAASAPRPMRIFPSRALPAPAPPLLPRLPGPPRRPPPPGPAHRRIRVQPNHYPCRGPACPFYIPLSPRTPSLQLAWSPSLPWRSCSCSLSNFSSSCPLFLCPFSRSTSRFFFSMCYTSLVILIE